jgi:hypothetical protein
MSASPKVFNPPNMLKAKLGGRVAPIDADALARAEATLQSPSGQFQEWMEDELKKLVAAHVAAKADGWSDAAMDVLYGRSHDTKGLAGTYEYPLVTRLAGSLCRLIDKGAAREKARSAVSLIDAHVGAMQVAVRDQVKSMDHPVGTALLGELERRTADLIAAP